MLNITISIRKEQNENDRCDSIQILRVLTKLKMPKYYGYFSLWRKGDKEGFSPELDFGFSYSDLLWQSFCHNLRYIQYLDIAVHALVFESVGKHCHAVRTGHADGLRVLF